VVLELPRPRYLALCVLCARSPRRGHRWTAGATIGALAGFTQNILTFYWLYATLRTFSTLSRPLCLTLTILLCIYQGGRLALFAWLCGRAQERGWKGSPVFLLAFLASELAYPMLFPYYLGDCLHQMPSLIQAAELGGPYLVGIVILMPNMAAAEVALSRLCGRATRWSTVVAGGALPVIATIGGLLRLRQIDARVLASEPVHAGIVQANVAREGAEHGPEESLHQNWDLTTALRHKGVDFVVWSEGALDAIAEDSYDAMLQRMFTRRLKVSAVFGAILVKREGDGQRAYNAALATLPDGRVVGRYDKRRLFPFGEYIPGRDAFSLMRKWWPNAGKLTPGSTVSPILLNGHPIATLICYEDVFPAFVNGAARSAKAEMLVTLTNDTWFGDTSEPWGHLAVAQMRAVEHRLYSLRSANSGVSAIIDPGGRVVLRGTTFKQETLDATVHWMKPFCTGYEIWGDGPWWCAAAVSVILATFKRGSLIHDNRDVCNAYKR
jgi:apolipoprotein N-acyltransferase